MKSNPMCHLTDHDLPKSLAAVLEQERAQQAELLAHIGEIDARCLYESSGYPSMLRYCVEELGLDEEDAQERVEAARVARRFPAIFEALAEGRLHVQAVLMVAPHLTEQNSDELLAAAS